MTCYLKHKDYFDILVDSIFFLKKKILYVLSFENYYIYMATTAFIITLGLHAFLLFISNPSGSINFGYDL